MFWDRWIVFFLKNQRLNFLKYNLIGQHGGGVEDSKKELRLILPQLVNYVMQNKYNFVYLNNILCIYANKRPKNQRRKACNRQPD